MTTLPTLRQLRYLVAVAETKHFGRAADNCSVTQSTMSAGIQELENILGAKVMERSKRRVMLTPLGEELVSRARRVLAEVQDMVGIAQLAEQPLSGLIRLGVIPTVGPYLLPRLLPRLRSGYPDLRLFLREDQTAALLDLVGVGELDVVLVAEPYDLADYETLPIGRDQFWLACANDHPLARKAAVSAREIDPEGLLVLEEGHCLRDHTVSACRRAPGRRAKGSGFLDGGTPKVEAASLFTLIELVAGGFGVTLVPDLAVKSDLFRSPDVALRPLTEEAGRTLSLAWRKTAVRRDEFELLGQFMRDQVVPG